MEESDPHAGTGQPPGDAERPTRRSRRVSSSGIVWGALLGILATVVVLFVYSAVTARTTIPPLTEAGYEAALERWKTNGPTSYDLDLVLGGNQTGNIHVEVRDGQVTRMTRNGVAPERRASWDYWSVDSQFQIIGDEMDMARDPKRGFPAPPGSRVIQRADFDPELGYPREYQRMVLGTRLDIHWKIAHFESIPAKADGDGARK